MRAVLRPTLFAAFAFGLALSTPARADTVTETRPIGSFRTVKLLGSGTLVLTQADAEELKVEAETESMQFVKVETRGDELLLSYEPNGIKGWWNSERKTPRFLLSARTLERLSSAGSGDIRSESLTLPGDLEISIAGSSDVRIKTLAARKLLVRISGNGDVSLAGGVYEQNVRIAGSGEYRCGSLQSATATVSIGGSGDATLWARDNLSVKIAGSGDVKYYGRPTLSKSIAGSGSVTGLGDKP